MKKENIEPAQRLFRAKIEIEKFKRVIKEVSNDFSIIIEREIIGGERGCDPFIDIAEKIKIWREDFFEELNKQLEDALIKM
jgi:hypothetical protein